MTGIMEIKVGPVSVKLKDDDRICGHIKKGEEFEPETLSQFADMIDRDKLFIDVGCYSGLFAIAAAKMGAQVIAVEPMPVNQQQIKHNMRLNEVEFRIYRGAASDFNGKTRLGYNPRVHLTAGASIERKSGPGLDVEVIKLDSLIGLYPERLGDGVGLIKIDVERHELAVLNGAQKILSDHRPWLIVEALDEKLKRSILERLPDYELVGTADTRNLLLRPHNA